MIVLIHLGSLETPVNGVCAYLLNHESKATVSSYVFTLSRAHLPLLGPPFGLDVDADLS